MSLVAIDLAGQSAVLETFAFAVEEPPAVSKILGVEPGWRFDTAFQGRSYIDTGAANHTFAVGDTYYLPPINISTFATDAGDAVEGIEVGVVSTLLDAPPGFLIDPRNGLVGGASNVEGGPYATSLVAIDPKTLRRSAPLEEYSIVLKPEDTASVLAEIFQDGALPYGDLPTPNVIYFVAEGERMTTEDFGCSPEVYAVLHACWQAKPKVPGSGTP